MCGICGIYNINGKAVNNKLLEKMSDIIKHRGPDDEGYLLAKTKENQILHLSGKDTIEDIKKNSENINGSSQGNLGLGFRRLSIIDLTSKGHQPMSDTSKNYWIVFNGEIYNYIELREELIKKGYNFHSSTDTEVIINAYKEWGTDCLNKFNGMWAFALWDNNKKQLFCARDRFGIKPFYYYFDGNTFIFGSEIKQILLHDIPVKLNEEEIDKTFRIGSYLINSEKSLFNNINTLTHSHYLLINESKFEKKRYYDLHVENFETLNIPFDDAIEEYLSLFKESVKLRMRSDVEVGSALSGGLDSSAIVVSAVNHTKRRFKTFSAFYPLGDYYDERKWINLVNERTNSIPHLISPTPEDILKDWQKITFHHDLPVSSSSVMSQYYVMKLARANNVTVLLDGQGSDEITGGYNHTFYRYYADLIKNLKFAKLCKEMPEYLKYNKKGNTASKLIKTGLTLFMNERALYKLEAKKYFTQVLTISPKYIKTFSDIKNLNSSKLSNFLYNQVMTVFLQTLLHFEDRNSMAHSIESRVPFLDYRLVEFAFKLPSDYKVNRNYGKYIHRMALNKIAPKEIAERKDKIGFTAPGEAFWLKKQLKPMLDGIFASEEYKNRGIYNYKLIDKVKKDYFNGNQANGNILWKIISTEIWFNIFFDNKSFGEDIHL